eukprot:TRINITY_DN11404_c0_g4_i1.p1 TRINITY_DN11404_c0_g4~~TRINITY_DN11404_c0_g4_i1.p1  ORF type:complete len:238 (-),score=39.81 TRINITY_DN11404_c0_g4_i1:520-1233(-)
MKTDNLFSVFVILNLFFVVSFGQRLDFVSAIIPTPTPTPTPDPGFFITAREPVSPTPTPPSNFQAVIRSPTPTPTPGLDLDITAVIPTPDPSPPFSIPPVITAPGPQPDSCSVKLENLKECLDKKADFVALGLTHYSYDIQRSCFCFPEGYTELASVSVCGGSQTEPEYYPDHNTMIKVFDYLCEAIMEADSVDVTYDNTYHFPTSIFVDYIQQAIDDENSYSITNFQVLTQDTCFI